MIKLGNCKRCGKLYDANLNDDGYCDEHSPDTDPEVVEIVKTYSGRNIQDLDAE